MDPAGSHRTVARIVRSGFVIGLLLIAPLAITFFVVRLVYGWIVGNVTPFLKVVVTDVGPVIELVAVGVLFVAITMLGLTVRFGFGHYVVEELDDFAKAIPVVRTIYASVRQASNALVSGEQQFEQVVLVEWPRPGYHTIGFVTDDTPEEITTELVAAGESDERRYNVYVPMSPNPTGGFLAIVPESKLVHTDMAVSDAVNLAITTGVGDEEFSVEDFAKAGEPERRDPAA